MVRANSQLFLVAINAVEAKFYENDICLIQFYGVSKYGHPIRITALKDLKALWSMAKETCEKLAQLTMFEMIKIEIKIVQWIMIQ